MKFFKEIKNRVDEAPHYPEDPEEWAAMYGPKKAKPERDPEDYEPRVSPQQQAHDDEEALAQKLQARYKKFAGGRQVSWKDEEGTAPNGQKYNKLYVIDAKDAATAEHEAYLFDKDHWGAKEIVDTKKIQAKMPGGPVRHILYIKDNHKHGTWKPFKESTTQMKEAANPEDKICVDIPLFIRLMEYAREDARNDMDLHRLTEKLTAMSATGRTLTMADYDRATGTDERVMKDNKPEIKEGTTPEMASSDLKNAVSSAKSIYQGVKDGKPVPAWAFEYIAIANDHLESVREYMNSNNAVPESTGPMKIISRMGDDMDESVRAVKEVAPPNFPMDLEKKLLNQYKDEPNRAYATMWTIHNRNKKKTEAKMALPAVNENEYWCKLDRKAKPIPEGYKKLASGYLTRK